MANITVSASRNYDDGTPVAITGSITSSTSSTSLTGTGTTFNTTNTPVGSSIFSGTTFIGVVASITNTTTIVLTANAAVAVTGATDGFAHTGLVLGNGENITINSGVTFTVNSDGLYAQQAALPTNVNSSGTGKLRVDASEVWWIPFDASSGNVPYRSAYGTTDVTIGGSGVGEYLGIWGTYGVLAPNAAGGAMPATGFVKLRRKTGTIADNDVLTFANGATATVNSATGGRRGWLWFALVNLAEANGYFGDTEWQGDWFELGTSNGTTSQTMQFFAPFRVPAIQIETGSGTGVYEWWCNSINLTSNFDFGNASNRTFSCNTSGVISFTNRAPVNGAKVRCPNLLHGYDMAGNNKTRGNFRTQGLVKMNKVISCHLLYPSTYPGLSIDFSESAFSGTLTTTTGLFNAHKILIVDDCAVAGILQDSFCPYFFSGSSEKVSINKLYAANAQTAVNAIATCPDVTVTNSYFHVGSTSSALSVTNCRNITMTNCDFISTGNNTTPLTLTACSRGYFQNIGVEPSGAVGLAVGGSNMAIAYCNDLVLDNFRHPPNFNRPCSFAWVNFDANNNVHFRNFGTVSTPYVNFAGRSMAQGNGNRNCSFSRIYTAETGGGWFTIHGYQNKNISSNDYIPTTTNVPFFGNQTGPNKRKYGSNPVTTNRSSTKELAMFSDYQSSTTSIVCNLITRDRDLGTDQETDAYTILAGTPTFDSLNSALYMPSLNDEIVYTWLYKIKSLTAFANTTPVVGGVNTGNIEITYDLDKGTGFSGTYKILNTTNLTAETGLNKNGTGIRIKFKTTTANSANAIYRVHFYATTTATDIANYLYPLSNPQISVTQALSSTLAALFNTSTGELLAVRTGSSTITLYPDYYSTVTCALRINKPGYESLDTSISLTEYAQAIPIQQVDTVVSDTNPGALGITVTNHGASPVTWNSKQFSVTVTVTDGSSVAQIARFLSWQRAQDAYNLLGTLHNAALHDCVIPVGTGYETARGTVYGSAGAALKGVRVVDGSGNEVPGFARMQADDGSYYVTPNIVYVTVGNVISGDTVLVARQDGGGNILENEYTPVAASAGASSLTIVESIKIDTPTTGFIRIKQSRYTYTGYNSSTKTFSGLSPTLLTNIVAADDVFVPFIDKTATSTSEQASFVFDANFNATVRVRNGSSIAPIIPFETTINVTNAGGSVNASRIADI